MGIESSNIHHIDTRTAFRIIAVAEMAQGAVIVSNAATYYCQMYEGSLFTRKQVIWLGVAALFQFTRGLFLRLLDPEDQDWTAIVACLIEVLYVTLNMSVYWNFAFKYLTTSLELEEFIKHM